MNFNFKINPDLTVPIYRQLADAITFAVNKGDLEDKDRLPTVQEMSDMLKVARGTVKKAYDELEHSGLIEKVQGRGTFVSNKKTDSLSRKEQAMSSIDIMLDNLESLGFSAAEINIFLNLKLKERADKSYSVKIALFECTPENLTNLSDQLHSIKHVELYSYLIDSIRQNPYKVTEDLDLAVTTRTHADEIFELLPNKTKVIRSALRLTPECLSAIVKLRTGQNVGVACYSERFGLLLKNTCDLYTEGVSVDAPFVFSPEQDIKEYLKDKNAVLVPEHYEKYCTPQTAQALHNFKGQIIPCTYEFDEGSILYLSEKVKRILESKSL